MRHGVGEFSQSLQVSWCHNKLSTPSSLRTWVYLGLILPVLVHTLPLFEVALFSA